MPKTTSSRKRKHMEVKVYNSVIHDHTTRYLSQSERGNEPERHTKRIANKASFSGSTSLCGFCKAIFESWGKFLCDKEFQLPHYASHIELNASAKSGCPLCAQLMFRVKVDLAEDKGKMDDAAEGFYLTVTGASVIHIEKGPGDATAADLEVKSLQGYVRHYPPGDGRGCVVEKTHRLEIFSPGQRVGTINKLISMVLVNDACGPNFDIDDSNVGSETFRSTQDAIPWCKEWLKTCEKDHIKCKIQTASFTPTRLISVRGTPRVVWGHDLDGVEKYATLSHCWGSHNFFALSRSNLEGFRKQIPADALPKTFLDAIFVCRQVGVDYIWIDVLCIVQDDRQDWQEEAALMSDVYGHSFINIAASGAVDATIGLFFQRSATWRCRVGIPLAEGRQVYECVRFNMHHESIRLMPLSKRGWAMQERLLPRRTLLFTATQVFWEYNENIACERFPESYPAELFSDEYDTTKGASRKQRVHEVPWHEVVEQYSRCSLTFQQDKLVAISGIARKTQLCTKDLYVAGLWKTGLEQTLLWYNKYDHYQVLGDLPAPSQKPPCKAPSWSWMSIDAAVTFIDRWDPQYALQIRILDIYIPPNEDPFGPTSTARISLACSSMMGGILAPTSVSYRCTDLLIGREIIIRDIHPSFSQPCYKDNKMMWLLPVWIRFFPAESIKSSESHNGYTCIIRGLILRDDSGLDPGCYERVGSFFKSFAYDENILCGEDLNIIFAKLKFEATQLGIGDFAYNGVHVYDDGVSMKVITLV